MRVLVVDDHPKLRANVRAFLRIAGIESDEAITGDEALAKAQAYPYGAIILDMNLPIMDGKTFLAKIRSEGNSTPVLVLTSDALLSDKVRAFDLGADDYLVKPFESEELIARVKAMFRRTEKPIDERSEWNGYSVDLAHMKLEKDGEVFVFPAKEWGIFEFLFRNRGIPKNKTEILEVVWGEREERLGFDSVTLEAHISSLRRKIGKDTIRTIRNVWYVID